MSKRPTTSIKRREFLKAAGLGTVAGAAAVAMGGGKSNAAVSGKGSKARGRGYRQTAHVNRYYELAKF